MKKIINNLVYNTETAEEIGSMSWGDGPRDFHYMEETLYRKRTGEFFLYGEGGPATKYAVSVSQRGWRSGEKIIPLDFSAAREWAEENLSADDYEKVFGEVAEDDSRVMITLSVSRTCAETITRKASEAGVTKSEYIENLVLPSKVEPKVYDVKRKHGIDWHIISPDGEEFRFHSLADWLKENSMKYFGVEPDSKKVMTIRSGFSNAKRAMQGGSYPCTTYKGWKIILD
jgi:hypothetical protein